MNMTSKDIMTVPCNCAHELTDRITTDINSELKNVEDLGGPGRRMGMMVAVEVSIDLDSNLASFRTATNYRESDEVCAMIRSADYIDSNGCAVPVDYLFWSGAAGYIDYQTVKKWILKVFANIREITEGI